MMSVLEIMTWLKNRFYKEFDPSNTSAFLFGSIFKGSSNPNDCDLLLVFEKGQIHRVNAEIPIIQRDFFNTFHLPLHITRLTWGEVEEKHDLIQRILGVSSNYIKLFGIRSNENPYAPESGCK